MYPVSGRLQKIYTQPGSTSLLEAMTGISSAADGQARPFLKWAGGKTQLLEEFAARFPPGLRRGDIRRYVEPFVGGGAVYFMVTVSYPVRESLIWDANPDLVTAYAVVKGDPEGLIRELRDLESRYRSLGEEERKAFYYRIRERFNRLPREGFSGSDDPRAVQATAALVFLNRTCYNGLYRVNSRGGFNVPFGKYRNPRILDETGLRAASAALATTQVHLGDFTRCTPFVNDHTFVYLDPPYRPLSRTSSFTAYARAGFGDEDQRRLARFFRELDRTGARLMLSNSDPMSRDPGDRFLEDLYRGYRIERVPARRAINSVGGGRGRITELIITNY
ncbi:MAG: DNA adenine methylase [Methanomicrobiales archaeon]|nr:DNA adenine methylase [Methanomicrobiales archaeon]